MKTNWPVKKLGEVLELIQNGINAKQMGSGKFPISRIETLQDSSFDPVRVKYTDLKDEEFEKYKYEIGDIAFSHINSFEKVGKVAIYKGKPENLVHGVNLLRLKVKKDTCIPEYLFWYLQTKSFREQLEPHIKKAINQASVNQTNLKTIEIPVPPLGEQKRIVAKLEKILAKIEEAKTLRQESIGETGKVFGINLNKVFSDPKWEMVALESVTETIYRYPSFYGVSWETAGTPVLRGENILNSGAIDQNPASYNYVSDDISQRFPKTILEEGDLVISVRGTIGKVAVVDKDLKKANISPNLLRVEPRRNMINSKFLYYFLKSSTATNKLIQNTTTATIPTIKASNIKTLEIPLPDLKEQEKIVAYLDSLSEKIRQLQELQNQTQQDLELLTQSVLHQAFEGKL